MTVPVIIIGAGGHARVLISSLKALRREIIGILHPDVTLIGQAIVGIPVIGNDDKILEYSPDSIEVVNGIGSVSSTKKRQEIYAKFKKDGYSFATIIHPAATIMEDVKLGEGVQIMAGAIVQTGCVIGDNAIINTGAIVDHDCIIGEHVHIAPGAVLSGGVHIGDSAHVGTSAIIIQGIHIGQTTVVGAGSVVVDNIPEGIKVVGVPAREREA
jgi:sugar O-acyltransferase (sialic acid O-acetyltransferase NeuD family)